MSSSICCHRCGKSTTSVTEVIGFVDDRWKCVPSCDVVFLSRKQAFEEALKYPRAKVGRVVLDNSGPIRITHIDSVEEQEN